MTISMTLTLDLALKHKGMKEMKTRSSTLGKGVLRACWLVCDPKVVPIYSGDRLYYGTTRKWSNS